MSHGAQSEVLLALAGHGLSRPHAIAAAEIDESGRIARSHTYSALAGSVARRAAHLAAATRAGDTVIGVLPSGIDAVAFLLAALGAGVRWAPMDARAAPAEIRALAQRTGAKLAVVRAAPAAPGALAGVCPLLTFPEGDGDHEPLGPRASAGAGPESPRGAPLLRGSTGAIVLASSGTTARPKLALRESAALDADAAAVIAGTALTSADCVLVATSLSHSYGVDMLLATISAGAALHIATGFSPAAIRHQVDCCATVLPGVPFTFEALARAAPMSPGRLRLALSAGAPLPARVRKTFTATWGIAVGNLYGATELGTVAMNVPAGAAAGAAPAGFVGKPLGGARFRIVDPADPRRQLAAGEEGHLAVWSPSMLSRYLDEETPLIDGHFLTGDLARLDTEGSLFITGRLTHLIDLGSFKVNPLEIEAQLLDHPGVADCAVVPVHASETRSRLRALIVPREGHEPATPELLRAFLRPRLSASKIPRAFDLVASLPRSSSGKLLRGQC
ncbi:MAG: class I adenylate-forming enzyme family protein [Phycisphaerales bacterium]